MSGLARRGISGATGGIARVCAACLLVIMLAGCAQGKSQYTPVSAGSDPYARLRERSEEYYQSGLAFGRAGDWRRAVQSFEQAILWDPDNRANLRTELADARTKAATLDPTIPTATPTFRPAGRVGAMEAASVGASPTLAVAKTPTRTPSPTPTISRAGYRTFRSKGLPYSIAYPVDWTVREGAVADKEKRVDAFAGLVAGRAGASVVVTGVTISRAISPEQFYLEVVESLRQEADFRELAPRLVGGTTAYAVSHTMIDGGKTYVAVHAILLSGNTGWLITLVATPDTLGSARAIYDVMLASFQPVGAVD